ncbi:hypothetical protein PROFUN_17159, partial [Planoprotostelium fungivorum]
IACSLTTGRIFWVSGPHAGSIHDLQVARNSGFYRKAYNIYRMTGLKIYGDAGYQGASWAILPFTERYGHAVSPQEERYNYAHSGRRIIVEQVFHRLKSFTILRSKYRGRDNYALHSQIFSVICAIFNMDIVGRPLRPAVRPLQTSHTQ